MIFVSQGAENVVSSGMPCAQEHMMIFDMSDTDFETSMHLSMQMDDSAENCCEKECCCPDGVFSAAIFVDDPFKTQSDFTHAQVISFESAMRSAFLTQLQRPPRNHLV